MTCRTSARLFLLLAIVWAGAGILPSGVQGQSPPSKPPSSKEIVQAFRDKKDQELTDYLRKISGLFAHPAGPDRPSFTDAELDAIIHELKDIEKNDPTSEQIEFNGASRTVYPNRSVSELVLFYCQFRKIANGLNKLPPEQRVAKLVAGLEKPPKGLAYDTTGSFAGELEAMGKEAVPFVIQHRPRHSYQRSVLVTVLEEIGDPRGVDYIIEVLQTQEDDFRVARPGAARALASFRGDKVLRALNEALRDETFEDIDRQLPMSPDSKYRATFIGRHYSVQHAAAKSLTTLTGHDWGLLFNEDYQTWHAWLEKRDKTKFKPAEVLRSKEELAALVEKLFHRYLSGRPNPWQTENTLDEQDGVKSLASELRQFGKPVVPLLLEQYRTRSAKTPAWEPQLREWTVKLLHGLGSDEADQAAEEVIMKAKADDGPHLAGNEEVGYHTFAVCWVKGLDMQDCFTINVSSLDV